MALLDSCIFVLTLCLVTLENDAAKILAAFPVASVSHQVVFRPFTQELARRGHDVTVLTTDPAFEKGHTPPNLTEIDIHDLSYGAWRNVIRDTVKGSDDTLAQLVEFNAGLISMFELQFKSAIIKKMLEENKHFDLIIVEACVRPPLIYTHLYKAPVIAISTGGGAFYNYEMMGMPTHPVLYPTMLSQKVYNLSAWEKVRETYAFLRMKAVFDEEKENAMLKRLFGPETPGVLELSNNVDMWFVNSHPLWMGNIPVPPSVVHIWGIYQREKRELPKDLKSYLDTSKHGVIYMSFGTNTFPSSLPAEKIQAFVKVFSELPYDVLWKWDQDELPGRTENIRIGKWFPQSDLLRHPKVKLFITQGGLQSTEEAINAGVPLIGVPILGDQWYNVEKYKHFKIGKVLDLGTLTEEDLRDAIKTVLSDKSFRENVAKLRSLMRDEPQPALERAVWWTEHVLRHGGAKHLRAPAANLTWGQYYEMPLVATVLLSLIVVIVSVLFVLRRLVRCLMKSKSKVKTS